MIYKVTFGFAGAQGWGETHAMISGLNDPILLVGTVRDIANKRAQMLGREFFINAIRISRYSDDAGNRTRGIKLVKEIFRNANQTLSARAEPAEVALLADATAAPSLVNPRFNANTNRTFLGAPLDVSVDAAGQVFPGNGGLGAAFASWASAMTQAGMGWLASDTILDVPLTTITQNVGGTVQLVTGANLLPTATQGLTYRGRIRGVNNGHSPLNGEVIISVDDNHTMTTQAIIGIPTIQNNGFIRIYRRVAPFIGYGTISLAEQVGNHKRGVPFGSRRGRRQKRIRG